MTGAALALMMLAGCSSAPEDPAARAEWEEANDPIEATVIARLFGDRPLVNSTKSLLGHTIGASGAFEAAVTALSLRDQTTHPCRNLEHPIAPLAFVRERSPHAMHVGLSQSFAFGGHNAALVIERADDA